MRPSGKWFILSKENALKFINSCYVAGIEILGEDGFFLDENNTVEPSMANSIDFTSAGKNYYGSHEKAIDFINDRNDSWYFEIVCKDATTGI